MCGVTVALEEYQAHHRKLRSQGGQDDLDTLVCVCAPCHLVTIHGHPAQAREHGWIVPSHANPATSPIHRFDGRWYLPGDAWRPTTPPEGDTP